MSSFREIYPVGVCLPTPPIGFEYKIQTFIPTDERVGSGWPPEGVGAFLVRKAPPPRNHQLPFEFKEVYEMKRYANDSQGKRGKWKPSEDPFLQGLPTINQLMTDCQWEDGKPRIPCSLKVRIGEEQASVVLTDEENKMSIATTGDTLREVLELLEAALVGNRVRWKPWGDFNKKK